MHGGVGRPAHGACRGLALAVGSGGYIFYNTHILNDFRTFDQKDDKYSADYEKTLLLLRKAAPAAHRGGDAERRALSAPDPGVETTGSYTLENRTG